MGFSNLKLDTSEKLNKKIDNLLKRAISEIEENWNRFTESKKHSFYFIDSLKNKIKITVKVDEESYVKKSGEYSWIICLTENDKPIMLSSLVHEITHISQSYNGFHNFIFKKQFKKFRNIVNNGSKLKYERYYNEVGHSEMETEHEAKLLQLYYLLTINYELALEHLLANAEYFPFSYKDILKKGYDFGISLYSFNFLRNKLLDFYENLFSRYYDLYLKSDHNVLFYFYQVFEEHNHLLKSFKFDFNNHIQWIIKEIKNNGEVLQQYRQYNWDVIESNLSHYAK